MRIILARRTERGPLAFSKASKSGGPVLKRELGGPPWWRDINGIIVYVGHTAVLVLFRRTQWMGRKRLVDYRPKEIAG